LSTNASSKYAHLENPRVKQCLRVYMRIAVSESPVAAPPAPPATIPFIWFPTPSAELEAATRTCLTQTGASGTSNSFSTLRWDPFAVLALPACPFRFRRCSLPLPFSSSTHLSSPPLPSSPLAPDPLVPSPSISSASPRLALTLPRHPSYYRRSNDKDVLCNILETEKDVLCKILETENMPSVKF